MGFMISNSLSRFFNRNIMFFESKFQRKQFSEMLDGSGVKAMPGSIPEPNPGSFNN